MYTIGLDIGTTTVSAVAVSDDGKASVSVTLKNNSFISDCKPFERLQSPELILNTVREALCTVAEKLDGQISSIGVTGQMHGILYCDADGNCISPLYIWQDGRGNERTSSGETYCEQITRLCSYPVATGFGLVTHYYNTVNSLVPHNAAKLCTVHDYAVMHLTGRKAPLVHASDAASLGLYKLRENEFDLEALRLIGLDTKILPEVTAGSVFAGTSSVDYLPEGIPVSVAIGDNQASFLGSVDNPENTVLVNMGTGSQVSVITDSPAPVPVGEIRPFIDGRYLFVGSSLCGGRAYQILADFFKECGELFGIAPQSIGGLFPAMDKLSRSAFELNNPLTVNCEFCGTRQSPDKTGAIDGITDKNFTPTHLICGVLNGTVNELYGMYSECLDIIGAAPTKLAGSGNGIRKSPVWQRLFSEKFNLPLTIPEHEEEAAHGAASFAAKCKHNI